MNLARHYRTLGLRCGASAEAVKVAYRKLVRQYHPDINPDAAAVEQFILINDAYTVVLEEIESAAVRKTNRKGLNLDGLNSIRLQLEKLGLGNIDDRAEQQASTYAPLVDNELIQTEFEQVISQSKVASRDGKISDERIQASQAVRVATPLSEREETLKRDAYSQLKELLSQQKFPLAIALIEGLAHRMPADSEVSQWQAIVYQRWGRRLILQGQSHKARIYLKKALRTDPNNQSLWSEVNRDFWHLASLGHQSLPAV